MFTPKMISIGSEGGAEIFLGLAGPKTSTEKRT
jgi:hypothetical protein